MRTVLFFKGGAHGAGMGGAAARGQRTWSLYLMATTALAGLTASPAVADV